MTWRPYAGACTFISALTASAAFIIFVTRPDIQDFATLSFYWLLLVASWNLLAGFGGQFSFAHVALAMTGGYCSAFAERILAVPPLLTLPLAGFASAAVGIVLGLFSLRVRGVYLSLITFGFAGAMLVCAAAAWEITNGYLGMNAQLFFTGLDQSLFLWLGLGIIAVYYVCQSLLLASGWGLQIKAVREREEVAEGLGVRTGYVKILLFAYTAFWAGVAGSFYTGYLGVISPSIGQPIWMGWVIAMAVVGGVGTAVGPIIGVILVRFLDFQVQSTGSQYGTLTIASVLIAFLLFVPDGAYRLIENAAAGLLGRRSRWPQEKNNGAVHDAPAGIQSPADLPTPEKSSD
jgi:branched-chain amino acid transport system permease protein